MQMIDVLKRLAELDANNPNIIKEGQVDECGMMDSMGSMGQPRTPASINMTASSGEELSGMLKDIMSLAGMKQVGPADLGHEHEPSVMTGEPGVSVAKPDAEPMDMKSMIAKMDTLNVPDDMDSDDGKDDEEEFKKTDETISSLSAPETVPVPPGTQDAAGHPGVGDRMDGDRPKAFPTETTYESLMADYRKFIAESDQDAVEENSLEQEMMSPTETMSPDIEEADNDAKIADYIRAMYRKLTGTDNDDADDDIDNLKMEPDAALEIIAGRLRQPIEYVQDILGQNESVPNEGQDILRLAGIR